MKNWEQLKWSAIRSISINHRTTKLRHCSRDRHCGGLRNDVMTPAPRAHSAPRTLTLLPCPSPPEGSEKWSTCFLLPLQLRATLRHEVTPHWLKGWSVLDDILELFYQPVPPPSRLPSCEKNTPIIGLNHCVWIGVCCWLTLLVVLQLGSCVLILS